MISVFDMFKVGIGPSSSHTVGPMRAACLFAQQIQAQGIIDQVSCITTELFGSLGQTGKGHGTGKAVILGLLGYSPEDVPVQQIDGLLSQVEATQSLMLLNSKKITFLKNGAIIFHRRKALPKHANGMTMSAFADNKLLFQCTYYSIGGGFIVEDKDSQLSLSWRTLYEKIKVTDVCFGCGTFQLNDKIKGLVKKIMVGKGNTLELSTEINKGKNKGVLFKIIKNDNWVWSKSGDKTINLVYEGDIRNNLPSGKGILSYKEKKIYEGDWVDGIRNGMGISFYDTGGKYFGEIKNGLLHGIGTFYYSDNTKVTGNFVEVDPNTLFLSSPEYIEFFLESQEFEFKVYDEKDNLMKKLF